MKFVQVTEVCPRDGFQSVREYIPLDVKKAIIEKLIESGIKRMQLTSFINPKAIPQMRDAAELSECFLGKYPGIDLFALVPNLRGARDAAACGYSEISTVLSVSESHNKANIRMSVSDSIRQTADIHEAFPDIKISQDLATSFGCPYEGPVDISRIIDIIGKLMEVGVNSFTLCDTIGAAYPSLIKRTIEDILSAFPGIALAVHIHDTHNMGMVNSITAASLGITGIQSSAAGLGGCPFAPGASGNTATEDLVYMLEKEGYVTNIDFDKLLDAAKFIHSNIDGNFSGHHISITSQQCGF